MAQRSIIEDQEVKDLLITKIQTVLDQEQLKKDQQAQTPKVWTQAKAPSNTMEDPHHTHSASSNNTTT